MSDAPEYLSRMDIAAIPGGKYLVTELIGDTIRVGFIDLVGDGGGFDTFDSGGQVGRAWHKAAVVGPVDHASLPVGLQGVVSPDSSPEGVGGGEEDESADTAHSEPVEDAVDTSAMSGAVIDWLVDNDVDIEHVQAREGTHNGRDGIIVDPDNQEMTDAAYGAFKAVVNGVDGSEAHVGFGDDPCHVCEESDGEFWYFLPAGVLPGLVG